MKEGNFEGYFDSFPHKNRTEHDYPLRITHYDVGRMKLGL